MAAMIALRAMRLGLSLFQICALVALVILQPAYGEVFFNLTTANWMLGSALGIYVLTRTRSDGIPSVGEYIFLGIACLTGPFSIFISPFLILIGLAHKDIHKNIGFYLTVLIGALIQAALIVSSNRFGQTAMDPNIGHWIKSFVSMISFGANSAPGFAAVILFWAAFAVVLVIPSKDRAPESIERKRIAWLLVGAAFVNILAALSSSKGNLMAIAEMKSPNRYFWIPNTFILFSALIASHEFKKLRHLILLSIGVICIVNFASWHPLNLQFGSYVKFSNYQNVLIPINPPRSWYPGWHINSQEAKMPLESKPIIYKTGPDAISTSGLTLERIGDSLDLVSKTNNPIIWFNNPITCPGASDIGVEVEMTKDRPGWLQLFWAPTKKFVKKNSIRRFYPAGEIKAQFAFPNFSRDLYLRFDPLYRQSQATIKKILIYCLR